MASFGKVVRALRTGLLITLGHFCASAVLAPYILFRFREDPYFLNRYNGAWESFYFSIADSTYPSKRCTRTGSRRNWPNPRYSSSSPTPNFTTHSSRPTHWPTAY